MNDHIVTIFYDNPEISRMIEEFCETDPEYVQARKEFYETAHEIERAVGYELYERFEQRFGYYLSRCADLHYLFGLGLRQEVLRAFLE